MLKVENDIEPLEYNVFDDLETELFWLTSYEIIPTTNPERKEVQINFDSVYDDLSPEHQSHIFQTVVYFGNYDRFRFEPDRKFVYFLNMRKGAILCFDLRFCNHQKQNSRANKICVEVE